jgi:hypothetical protein
MGYSICDQALASAECEREENWTGGYHPKNSDTREREAREEKLDCWRQLIHELTREKKIGALFKTKYANASVREMKNWTDNEIKLTRAREGEEKFDG